MPDAGKWSFKLQHAYSCVIQSIRQVITDLINENILIIYVLATLVWWTLNSSPKFLCKAGKAPPGASSFSFKKLFANQCVFSLDSFLQYYTFFA